MLGGAYSSQFKNIERQHVETIKTLAENEKSDAIARAKKMSVETNRRRRALAIKRKAEAEREEKRRQQILAKRREKQQEATEKFQRSHIPGSRPNSGASSGRWSPRRHHTQLDDALKLIRSSPASSRANSAKSRQTPSPSSTYYRQNSDPLSKPYFNKYAHPSINNGQTITNGSAKPNKQEELHNKSLRNLNNSRNLFEQQLENYQHTLYEQQQKTLQDFNKQVMQEIAVDKNVTNVEYKENSEMERSESLSSVDSLEDGGSNDTLRESCDLDKFMVQKNNANGNNSVLNGSKGVTFANESARDAVHINRNVSQAIYGLTETGPQNIDSYNTQVQALLGQTPTSVGQTQTTEAQRQQHYLQRQKEIQQQLQEQRQQQLLMQQKQQKELQQKVLEQQQKQQQMVQQQYERQKQEEAAEQQRLHHEQQQQQQQMSVAGTNTGIHGDEGKENHRPKLKAWGTPSPHPPNPSTTAAVTTHVTHASPYSGKNTHTNMTIPYMHNNNIQPDSPSSYTPSSPYNGSSVTPTRTVDRNLQAVANANASYYLSEQTSTPKNGQDGSGKNVSFLETVTDGLPVSGNSSSVSTSSAAVQTTSNSSVNSGKSSQQTVAKTNGTSNTSARANNGATTTTTSTPKPPIHPGYYNSYGAAYLARQQMLNGTNVNKQAENNSSNNHAVTNESVKTNGNVQWVVDEHSVPGNMKMLTPDTAINGDDVTDTDSVSTICGEERDPEPKEIRGILKRKVSGKKSGGILKKSGSTGNMKEIRDSLEITRVHLVTSAEEKEMKMRKEQERSQNPPPSPTKKNVRWHDLTYDEDTEQDECDDKVFTKRTNDALVQKPPRPISAVTLKANTPKSDSRPARAVSATVRTSTIPRAKTQVVRPQAAAHIITQSSQNVDPMTPNDKVTIVNSNFMEKIPSMVRANQNIGSTAPSSVYNANSTNYTQPQQKVNYAVSSIVMPKADSAPFVYSGNNKQGPVPPGCADGPAQSGTNSKYDGAVYDENGVRIDRTPTDDEINFLWDKLRTCLSRNSTATPDKGQSDTGGPRQAAPVAHTYIDGNALGQFTSLNRVAQPQNNNPAVRRQNSVDSAAGSYARRYGLLQQRKQQVNPNSLKARQQQQQQQQQQQGYTVYQPPVQSHTEPQPANVVHNGADVTESLAGFLAAEQLMEQSVSDSRVHQAIDEAQARQMAYNSARPQPKVKSALSIEEQRLMESLDRLNDKLKATEDTVTIANPANQPAPVPHSAPQQRAPTQQIVAHVGGFKGHTPLSQRRVIETGNPRARLKITSASLRRNLHRHQ